MADKITQKVVVKAAETQEHRLVVLRDVWCNTLLEKGTKYHMSVLAYISTPLLDDVVNIIGDWDCSIAGSPAITITSKENLLVHHPDYLISATSLSEGSVCRRKPLVSSLVRATVNNRASSLWGHILHEVMESCLGENRWDKQFIDDQIENVIRGSLLDLLRVETTIEEATEEIKKRSGGLAEFSKKYIGKTPKVEQILDYWSLVSTDGYFSQMPTLV